MPCVGVIINVIHVIINNVNIRDIQYILYYNSLCYNFITKETWLCLYAVDTT